MTTEEILIVDTHQYFFLIAVEFGERVALVDGDTRVQPSRTTLVFHEQHFAVEVNQSVADVMYSRLTQAGSLELFLIAEQAICPFLHFGLGVELGFEPVDISVIGVKGIVLCPLQIEAQYVT